MDKVSKPVATILNGEKKKKKGIHDVLNITCLRFNIYLVKVLENFLMNYN